MKKTSAFLLMLIFLLGGCGDRSSDMFAMPEIPEKQKQLVEIVETVLERGYEYSELRSGINRQPLQLVDLDGDGAEEGIAFLRDSADTYKTFIYIFKENDSGFRLYDIIEGPGNELFAVSYTDVVEQNGYEIVAEWESGDPENRIVCVYDLGSDGTERLLEVSAMNYAIADLDGDKKSEFVAITRRLGKTFADVYVSAETEMKLERKTALSGSGGEILGVKSGNITQDKKGIFTERRVADGKVFDVIAYNGENFVNLFPEGEVITSDAVCEDVDGDGITDIPEEIRGNHIGDGIVSNCYRWKNVGEDRKAEVVAFTYNAYAENWYLLMPVSWSDSVYAKREIEKSGCVKIHFSTRELLNDGADGFFEAPLFSVYVFTGAQKNRHAAQMEGFVIAEREDAVFKGEIISNSYLGTKIDEAFVKSMFKVRGSEWLSEIPFA